MLRRDLLRASLLTLTSSFLGCSIEADHDFLIKQEKLCNVKWADLNFYYQHQLNIIPQLIKKTKDTDITNRLAKAQAQLNQTKLSVEDLHNLDQVKIFQQIQRENSYVLNKLAENFTDFAYLFEKNKDCILYARKDYNSSVRTFNSKLRKINNKVINPITGNYFQPRIYFSA